MYLYFDINITHFLIGTGKIVISGFVNNKIVSYKSLDDVKYSTFKFVSNYLFV